MISPPVRPSDENFESIYYLSYSTTYFGLPILIYFLPTKMTADEHDIWSVPLCTLLCPLITSLLLWNIILSTLLLIARNLYPFLTVRIFITEKKQQEKW
jgi:hypothetical protein